MHEANIDWNYAKEQESLKRRGQYYDFHLEKTRFQKFSKDPGRIKGASRRF